jgi:hypothetical protein
MRKKSWWKEILSSPRWFFFNLLCDNSNVSYREKRKTLWPVSRRVRSAETLTVFPNFVRVLYISVLRFWGADANYNCHYSITRFFIQKDTEEKGIYFFPPFVFCSQKIGFYPLKAKSFITIVRKLRFPSENMYVFSRSSLLRLIACLLVCMVACWHL